MYRASVRSNSIRVENPDNEFMTSGSVNVNFIEFTFSDDWKGLFKTVLFQTKKVLLPIVLEGDERVYKMPIPWEVLVYAGEQINIGVYGTKPDDENTKEDEKVIMPTVWGSIPDRVKQGVVVSDPTPTSPTYDAYLYLLQLLEEIIEGGGGSGGTSDHSELKNRDLADQHPVDAISGLVSKFTQIDHSIEQVVSFIQQVASIIAGRSVLFTTIDDTGIPKVNDVRKYPRSEFVGIMPTVSETVRSGFLMLNDKLYLAKYAVTAVQDNDTTVTFVSDPTLIGPTSGGGETAEQRFTWLGYNDGTWNYVYDNQVGIWYDDTVFVHNFEHIIGNPDAGDPGIVFNLDKTGQYPPSLNLCTYKEAVLGIDGNVSHYSAWSNVHIPMDTIPMVRNYEFRNGVEAREKLSLTTDGDHAIVWMADNVKLYLSNAVSLDGDNYIKLFGPVDCWDTTFTPTADQTSFAECDRANRFRLFDGDIYVMPYKNYINTNDGKTFYQGYILEKENTSEGNVDIIAGDGLSKDGNTINVDNPMQGIVEKEDFDSLPEEDKSKGTYIVNSEKIWMSPQMTSDNEPYPYHATASSNEPSYGSSGIFAAFDGDQNTFWANAASDTNVYISFDFGSETYVSGISMRARVDVGDQLPYRFRIMGSIDGDNWDDILNKTDLPSNANGEAREFVFDKPVKYRFFRIDDMASYYENHGEYISFSEIKFLIENDNSKIYSNGKSIDFYNKEEIEIFTDKTIDKKIKDIDIDKKISDAVSEIVIETNDSYSTEERQIGTWIDGKPLYKKTIEASLTGSANGVVPTVPFDSDWIIVNANFWFKSKNNATFTCPFYMTPTEWISFYCISVSDSAVANRAPGAYFQLGNGSDIPSGLPLPLILTIEYTKVSDG